MNCSGVQPQKIESGKNGMISIVEGKSWMDGEYEQQQKQT